jgi:hypothetical protein
VTDYTLHHRFSPWVTVVLLAAVTALAAPEVDASSADPVQIQFDIAPLAVCRDVTTGEFAESNPNERLLETHFEVSTLILGGREDDLDEFFFRFSSPGQNLLITDYSPKTTLASEFAGNINVEQKNESAKSAGVTISSAWDHLIKIAGSGDLASKDHLAVRYELHSPMEPITASGTIARGTGVYFKFRPSRQTALEGSRNFSFVIRVPHAWRGDYLQVHCEARTTRQGVIRGLDEPALVGVHDFFVALYLAGDVAAKAAAEEMVRAELALQTALADYRETLLSESRHPVWGRLVTVWSPVRKEVAHPMEQIEQLIYSHSPFEATSIPNQIPGPLADALEAYLQARSTLRLASRGLD